MILTNPYVSIGGSDISSYVKSVTIDYPFEEHDDTAAGDTARSVELGLANWTITVTANETYANGLLNDIMWTKYIAKAEVALIIKINGGTTSTDNPKWTGNGMITGYPPISGAVGDQAVANFTIKPTGGVLTRAEAD